jgi:hypothetical protein
MFYRNTVMSEFVPHIVCQSVAINFDVKRSGQRVSFANTFAAMRLNGYGSVEQRSLAPKHQGTNA